MSVANQRYALEQVHNVAIKEESVVIDHYDPNQVAACLLANDTYVGYELDGSFSAEDVLQLAMEDAHTIIMNRRALLEARRPLQERMMATIRASKALKKWSQTQYVVVGTPVDQNLKVG